MTVLTDNFGLNAGSDVDAESSGRRRHGFGTAPGTCGELVQGVVGDNNFMISFPIHHHVWAELSDSSVPGVSVWPPGKAKARQAATRMLRGVAGNGGRGRGRRLVLRSDLPEGRGFASSSADIVATCRAVADFLGRTVSPAELAAIACGIEPSDAVMYEHPVVFDFLRGRLLADPGRRLPVLAVAVDIGPPVHTYTFRRLPYNLAERARLRDAHDMAVAGLRAGHLPTVARAATASARINQRRHVKPHLEQLIGICRRNGGHGVSVAHSGTVAAMLFDEGNVDGARRAGDQALAVIPAAALACLCSPPEPIR